MKNALIACLALMTTTFASAEIVKNSKGEKIELKSNGTWVLIPWTQDDYVNNDSKYSVKVPDGNKNDIEIQVTPDISLLDNGRQIKKEDLTFRIRMTSIDAQYKLKNKFSYVPKSVSVKQRGNNVNLTLEYTGKNSYGAEVPSYLTKEFYVEKDGKLKSVEMNP